MGYNAGGYGTMTFPDEAAVAKWKKATVSHAAYQDWIEELDSATYQPDETVAKRLARVAKDHNPKLFVVQEVAIEGPRVTLTWDTGEDAFRDGAGDFAALIRSAESFGAKGAFYFLGTAGAEGDFAYSLVLDGEGSRVAAVPRNKIMKVAYGEDYAAFNDRVTALMERGNPAMKKFMTSLRKGAAPKKEGDPLHREVVDNLEEYSDAQLAKTAAKYPSLVPNGSSGLGWAKDVYPAKSIRAQFEAPPNEETRAVALWTLGVLDADAAIPVAFAVLDLEGQNEHLIASALRVLAHATHDQAEAALKLAALHLQKSKSVYVFSGAQAVLLRSAHGKLDATLEKLLDTLGADRGGYVVAVLKQRRRKSLAPALARYVKRTSERMAKELLAAWKVR